MDELARLRDAIDQIDAEICRLFEARMDVAGAVAAYKRERNMPVLQPERERAVLERAAARMGNPDHAPGARMLFEALMAASRALQHEALTDRAEAPAARALPEDPLVAYPGAPGSFSEQAALGFFGETARTLAVDTFEAAARALAEGRADCAVLPLENSTAGSVDESYRLIEDMRLNIAGEQYVKVAHHLLGAPGAKLESVREVRSHPQAIAQCRALLLGHPEWCVVPCENTALAARAVRDAHDPSVAALASERAGALYSLTVLHRDAQDARRNATRFAVLTREPVEPPDADKASVVFTLPDEVGALARVMAAFARQRINLKRLQSRPVPEAPWTYRFHADLEWTSDRRALVLALEEAGRDAQSLTLLGLYANNREDAP